MKRSLLLLLAAVPAPATPTAAISALASLEGAAAVDPAAGASDEDAAARAGKGFGGQSFTIQTLFPLDSRPLADAPSRKEPTARTAPSGSSDGTNADYYFEGRKPLDGITIYTPVKGQGSTSGGESPTEKFGKYGKFALMGGAALGAAGLLFGATPILGLVAGLLIGAGAVLSFIFGKKK